MKRLLYMLLLIIAGGGAAGAAVYSDHEGLLGVRQFHVVRRNESLLEIARRHDLGYNAITAANRGVDPFVPIRGTEVTIPTEWLLPQVPVGEGIVINVPEMRLYYFPRPSYGTVITYPIGVGAEGKDTPAGRFRVVEKIVNPAWYVPASIRREKPELPRVVPPGPNNPMGNRALRLSGGSVLIHGTNRPWCVGRRASHGCIRLYPEDIIRLFEMTDVGTPVTIIYQPVKVAVRGGRVFLEVHPYGRMNLKAQALKMLAERNLLGRVDRKQLAAALARRDGLPTPVSW